MSAERRSDEAIRALCDAATPGPWEPYDSNEGTFPPRPGWSVANEAFHNPPADEDAPWIAVDVYVGTKADAEFIAASRELVPALLDEIEAQRIGAEHAEARLVPTSAAIGRCAFLARRIADLTVDQALDIAEAITGELVRDMRALAATGEQP